jgi:hypothetical protein
MKRREFHRAALLELDRLDPWLGPRLVRGPVSVPTR